MISHPDEAWNQYPSHPFTVIQCKRKFNIFNSQSSRQKKHSGQLRKLKPKAPLREPARIGWGWVRCRLCRRHG